MEEANEVWLEGVKDLFESEIANGDYVECKNIIEMVRIEGFDTEAKELERLLKEETIGTFLVESNPTLI